MKRHINRVFAFMLTFVFALTTLSPINILAQYDNDAKREYHYFNHNGYDSDSNFVPDYEIVHEDENFEYNPEVIIPDDEYGNDYAQDEDDADYGLVVPDNEHNNQEDIAIVVPDVSEISSENTGLTIDREGNLIGTTSIDYLAINLLERGGMTRNIDGILITVTGVLTFQGALSLYGIIDLWPGEVIQVQADMPNSAALDYDLFLIRTDRFGNILGVIDESFYTTYINGAYGTLPEAVGFRNITSSIMHIAIGVQSFRGSSTFMPYTVRIGINNSRNTGESIQNAFNPRVASVNLPASGNLNFNMPQVETLADNSWLRVNVPANRNFDRLTLSLDAVSAGANYTLEVYSRRADGAMRRIFPINDGFPVSIGAYYVRLASVGSNRVTGSNVTLSIAPFDETPIGTMTVGPQDGTFMTVSGRSGFARFNITTQNVPAGHYRVTVHGGENAALRGNSFSINANGTGTVSIWMNGLANGVIVPAGDYSISISLRDAAGNLVARSDNFIYRIVPRSTAGPLFQGVQVTSYRNANQGDAQTILRTTCTLAQIRSGNRWNQTVVYNLFHNREYSWYRVHLSAGQINYINVNPGGIRTASVGIYAPNGQRVFNNNSIRRRAGAFISSHRFSVPVTGFYYIRIAGDMQNQEIRWTVGSNEDVW